MNVVQFLRARLCLKHCHVIKIYDSATHEFTSEQDIHEYSNKGIIEQSCNIGINLIQLNI